MRFFLGIDLGTSYFKVGLFDEHGKLHGLGRRALLKNSDGAVCEVEIPVFWKTLRACIGEALKQAKLHPDNINAISYSSQANSFVLLNEAGKPLTSIILWSDERVAEPSEALMELNERSDFLMSSGLGIKPGIQSMIAKIEEVRKKEPRRWERVKHIFSISDYLVFSLTGHKISDLSTSSMTGLLDVPSRRWWKSALDIFMIDESLLSKPLNTGSLIGKITGEGAKLSGLSKKSLLFSGGLDHHMVAIGAGLPCSNSISESTGTVLACVNYTKGYHPRVGVNIAPGLDDDHYFQMAFDANGAKALEWYQINFASSYSMLELLELADKIEPGCDGLRAKPCANEYKWPEGFLQRKEGHVHAHYVRAILESTGLSLRDLLTELDPENKATFIIPSGGGARSRLWLNIKANIINKRFLLLESSELACKGAALLGAVGTSCYKSMNEAIENQLKTEEIIEPNLVKVEKYKDEYNLIKT